MSLCVPSVRLWFRVFDHADAGFSTDRVYRAVALADYSESACAQVFLISDLGYLWGVPQNKCVCVNPDDVGRPASTDEMRFALPEEKPKSDW